LVTGISKEESVQFDFKTKFASFHPLSEWL